MDVVGKLEGEMDSRNPIYVIAAAELAIGAVFGVVRKSNKRIWRCNFVSVCFRCSYPCYGLFVFAVR